MDETLNPNKKLLIEETLKEIEEINKILLENASNKLYIFNKYVLKVEEGDDSFVTLGKFHKEMCQFIDDRKDKKKTITYPTIPFKN